MSENTITNSGTHKTRPDEIKTYRKIDGYELTAHIFYAGSSANAANNPGLVFFHPGGWTMGEPMWGYEWCGHFAFKGMTSVSFQYRLSSPGGTSPIDALADVREAVRWTRQNADMLKIDPDKLIGGGISAGAHLISCAAILEDKENNNSEFSSVPNALILQSAVLNPVVLSDHVAELMKGIDLKDYSPFHHIKPGLPSFCLIHGTADDLVPFSSVKEFTDKMEATGNRCELHPYEGVDHFFSNSPDNTGLFKIYDEFLKSLGYM